MKTIIFLTIVFSLLAIVIFINFEGSLTIAASDWATTTVTLTVDSEISVTSSGDTTMAPNINISQDSSIGTSTFTVITNNTAGYTMTLQATTTPALHNGDNQFADLATTSPDTWDAMFGGASVYEFGFSAYGDDVAGATWGTDTNSCGLAGADTITATNRKWRGFYGENAVSVASKNSETSQTGTITTFCVGAEQGNSVFAPSGAYIATVVATATTQ